MCIQRASTVKQITLLVCREMSKTILNLLELGLRKQHKHIRQFDLVLLFLLPEIYEKKLVAMLNELISNFIHVPIHLFHNATTEEDLNFDINDICLARQNVFSIIDRHGSFCSTQAWVNLFSHTKTL